MKHSSIFRMCCQCLLAGLLSGGLAGAQTFEDLAQKAEEARQSGRLVEAIGLYRQALEQNFSWPEGWWNLATVLYDLDQYPEARDAFRKFLMLDRDSGPAWALLGLCEYQTREYGHALNSLGRARSFGTAGNQEIHYVASYHLALLLARFEEFESAFSILYALAREDFDSPRIVEALGIAVLRLPFLPHELPPDRRERVLLAGEAAAYSASMRADAARLQYEELVKRYPETANTHYAYGVFCLQNEPDKALAEFQKELEISPLHVPALLQIAFEYIRRGEPKSALAYARKAVELKPGSFAARNALGRALLGVGKTEEAVAELEKGTELAPDSPEMHFALARAYTQAGRKEDAERARQEFLRLNELARSKREGLPAVGAIPLQPSERTP